MHASKALEGAGRAKVALRQPSSPGNQASRAVSALCPRRWVEPTKWAIGARRTGAGGELAVRACSAVGRVVRSTELAARAIGATGLATGTEAAGGALGANGRTGGTGVLTRIAVVADVAPLQYGEMRYHQH